MSDQPLTCLEICAGAGGQALGLERAGFAHAAAVEIDAAACSTLRANRPDWNILESDARELCGRDYRGIDLLAGGVPCPPFSIAGKQLGSDDERDLFPTALRLVEEARPTAVLLENVRGLASSRFSEYRKAVVTRLVRLGYQVDWQVLNACSFRVPQLRPRFILVAIRNPTAKRFAWPSPVATPPTVGEALYELMAARSWRGAGAWAEKANAIAPTLVGGSKRHGGPDLGPTRARKAWREIGVNGSSLAELAPGPDFPVHELPRLTVGMAACIQGFPLTWSFFGRKTAAYRQVGNAFPPSFAEAVGTSIHRAITSAGPIRLPAQASLFGNAG